MLRNGTLINCAYIRSYFFFMQGEKRRQCLALARLFNAAEEKEQVEKCKVIIESFLKTIKTPNFSWKF